MRWSIRALLAALPLLLGVGEGTALPHNVLLSRLRTEPVVAIDPTNPSVVVAGANTNYIAQRNGTFPVPYFTSHDGGTSFSAGTLPMPQPYTTGADASIAIAGDGTVFYSYLAESPTYCSNGPGAVLLAHSIDHGVSFRGPVVVDSNPADDRPTLVVESAPSQASHLFVTWTRSYQGHSEIWLARSVDAGAAFSPAIMVYSSSLDNFGAEPVIGPHEHVYVFWLSHPDIATTAIGPAQVLVSASSDDGAHFGPVHGAGRSFVALPELGQQGALRDLTTLAAAAAPSGALYVAHAAERDRHPDGSVDADIWLARSLDEGTTWSESERVNDVRSGDRFMPALTVLGDGTIGVAFYDRRAGPGELDVDAVRVSFVGGFEATRNVRVNDAPSPVADITYFRGDQTRGDSCFPSGRFFGDYIGSASDGTMLGVAWAGARPQQKNETDLWYARVALPAVSLHLQRAPSRQTPPAYGSLLSWLGGIGGHMPVGEPSGMQVLLLSMLFLLPTLTVATALRSLRESSGR
jgi:hypothetical protein